jgi:hypothetical protein
MMATKKQMQKKKARELKGKARVAARRHKLEQIKKDERRGAKLNKKFREKLVPFVKDSEKKRLMDEKNNQKSLEKLEKNMQILKALEEEHIREAEERRRINEGLEAEGHITLQEKVKALEEKARASLGKEQAASVGIDLTAENSQEKI